MPPIYSAIRVDGTRLHELARKGIEVDRATRDIVVYSQTMRLLVGGVAARYYLEIHCGKGTYVLVIAEDLGRLGRPASTHLTSLRRTAVGPFSIKDAAPLAELKKDAPMVSLADALTHLPSLALDDAGSRRVRAGQERWLFGLAVPAAGGHDSTSR